MTIARFQLDAARSVVGFKVRHMVVSTTRGRFREVQGTLELDEEALTRSRVEVRVQLASVDTKDRARDENLRKELFDVARFPEMTFRSTSIRERGRGRLEVEGLLAIKGGSRALVLEVERSERVGSGFHATARAVLSRKEFGLTWNPVIETGGLAVADRVELELDAYFVPTADQ